VGEDLPSADAVPDIDRRSRRSPVLFTVEVNRERFAVRRSLDGGTDYEWLTGPDQGWATSDPPDRPFDAHVADLRHSLRQFAAAQE
jgi:hypothetical protein